MITFMDPKEKIKELDNCLDSQLWHACAGGMVQMPPVNTKVFYFIQGHIEHANGNIDFRNFPRVPPYLLCRVDAIKYLADRETDEVYAKIRLVPVSNDELNSGDEERGHDGPDNKPASFAKTLTQSDANNGGGFSVPRYCAETIFPRLDYSADPPVQNIVAKDVHGEAWKFRHIYRGTPRRHLLTTGWSTFVNAKKLVAGDSIVFLRADNGDLCVGIRRAKRGIGGGHESSSGWNPTATVMQYSGFSAFLREDENRMRLRNGNGLNPGSGAGGNNTAAKGKIKLESVIEAVSLAAKGQPFDVVYYPRAGTPEFVVKSGHVKAALQIRWCAGMRFKMPFETEDSSRISWFMGTISCVQVSDPMRWPDSPWRLLQVTWDEPDLLQNVKRVSPWLVELVSNMPTIHLSPFSLPRKKLRLTQHPELTMDGQFPIPTIPGNFLSSTTNPFGCLPENSPAGMQGARHAQFGLSSLPNHLHLSKIHSGLLPSSNFPGLSSHNIPNHSMTTQQPSPILLPKPSTSEDVSCLLTMGTPSSTSSTQTLKKSTAETGAKVSGQFVLFGKSISTEQQTSQSVSGDTASAIRTGNSLSDGNISNNNKQKVAATASISDGSGSVLNHNYNGQTNGSRSHRESQQLDILDLDLEIGQCKVFMEAEDVGRTLDLSAFNSYEEMCRKLASMFQVEEGSEMMNRLVYRDSTGLAKQIGDEPFSKFARRAKRLTILMDANSDNGGT